MIKKMKYGVSLMIWFFIVPCLIFCKTFIPKYELRKSEKVLFDLVNMERKKCGVDQLVFNSDLYKIAMMHNIKMASEDILSHNFPKYKQLAQRMVEMNLFFSNAGENIAFSDTYPPDLIHEAFVNSPSHYENLIDKKFKHCGIAILETDRGFYITQEFAEIIFPVSEKTALEKLNASVGKENLFKDKEITEKLNHEYGKILKSLSKKILLSGTIGEVPKSLKRFSILTILSNKIEDIVLNIKNSNKDKKFSSYSIGITFGRSEEYPGGVFAVVSILRKIGVGEKFSLLNEIEKKLLQMVNIQMVEHIGGNVTKSSKLSKIADKALKTYYNGDNPVFKYNKYSILVFQINESISIPKEHLDFFMANKTKKMIGIKVYRPETIGISENYLFVAFVFNK